MSVSPKSRKGVLRTNTIIAFVALLLALTVIACNVTAPGEGLATLTVILSTLDGEDIVVSDGALHEYQNGYRQYHGRVHSNQITFSKVKPGIYILVFAGQSIDDVNISKGANTLNLVLDDRFNAVRVMVINNTGQDLHALNVGGLGRDYLFPIVSQSNLLDKVLLNGDSNSIVLLRNNSGSPAETSIRYHSETNIFTKYELQFSEDSVIIFTEDDLDSFEYVRIYFNPIIFNGRSGSIVPWYNENDHVQVGIKTIDDLMRSYDVVGLSKSYSYYEYFYMAYIQYIPYDETLGGHHDYMYDLELRDKSNINEIKERLNREFIVIWAYLISEYEKGVPL